MPGIAAEYLLKVTLTLSFCAIGAAFSGCNRTYYRQKADHEVSVLVEEKSNDPRWDFHDFSIDWDPRSRYAEVHDPDFPPMPPDDPASHQFMRRVDGKDGYSGWGEYGYERNLENPFWEDQLASYCTFVEDEHGNRAIKLSLESALQIATIHSTDYQGELETLYLSALDVSTERFRFDVQFFGGTGLAYTQFDGGPATLRQDADGQWSRQFASAGELLVDFANNTVWTFGGGGTSNVTTSLLDFSIVQPLLRNAGRAPALEQLTIVERTLLANLRAMQRWRKGFYSDIAIGNSGVSGPTRRGGFLGGTGLTGFTGTGGGGFGGVGAATGFGGGFGGAGGGGAGTAGAGTGLAGGGAGNVGGFIGLLQARQEIRNTQESLDAQERTLRLLEANLSAGLIDIAQVDQFRQSIATQQAQLLQATNGLQGSLDNFKRGTLGLPPDLPITLDESPIERFQLIGTDVGELQETISLRLQEFGELPRIPQITEVNAALDTAAGIRSDIEILINNLPGEFEALNSVLDERLRGATSEEERMFFEDLARLQTQYVELQEQFDETGNVLQGLREALISVPYSFQNPERQAALVERTADNFVSLMKQFDAVISGASLIQARARLERITVDPIELDARTALEVARANRLDWMNSRASLVDSWRLIEFNANRLKSDLTVRFSGNATTVNSGERFPFSDGFDTDDGTLRASLQWDPPFTRLNERNNFRQQLIEYQQSRRGMIQFEDGVHQSIRSLLRDLEQLRVNLEIQRRAVVIAIRRVDQTTQTLNAPVPPAPPGQLPAAFGPTAAQNLLSALEDLRNVQNNMMSVKLAYDANRMVLYRDIGIMEIDESGAWIDRPLDDYIDLESAREHGMYSTRTLDMPPPVPPEWLGDAAFEPEPAPPAENAEAEPGPRLGDVRDQSAGSGQPTVGSATVRQADWDRDAASVQLPARPGSIRLQPAPDGNRTDVDRTAAGLGSALRQRAD